MPPSRSRLNIVRGRRPAPCRPAGSKESSARLHWPGNTKTGSGATAGARPSHAHYQRLISALVDGILHIAACMAWCALQTKSGCGVTVRGRAVHGHAQKVCLASGSCQDVHSLGTFHVGLGRLLAEHVGSCHRSPLGSDLGHEPCRCAPMTKSLSP